MADLFTFDHRVGLAESFSLPLQQCSVTISYNKRNECARRKQVKRDWLEALAVPPGVISVIGGGGKTHLCQAWLETSQQRGEQAVLWATSTRMFCPKQGLVLLNEADYQRWLQAPQPAVIGRLVGDKLVAPDWVDWSTLKAQTHRLFIEADGSRGLPLKRHLPGREPVIIPETTAVYAVVGLSAWGRRPAEVVHRYEGDEVTPIGARSLLAVLQAYPSPDVWVFNQGDRLDSIQTLQPVVDQLGQPCYLTSLQQGWVKQMRKGAAR